MIKVSKSEENPILLPKKEHSWEAIAAFNASAIYEKGLFHLFYRAESSEQEVAGHKFQMSSIGHTASRDGIHFKERTQFIKPEYDWEKFGCEDPRITKFEGKYYIFYTALSTYPFSAEGIKVGVAVSKDLKTIKEKHPVTFFNSKAMTLFPERINGKITAMLTVHTDKPPAQICLAQFDHIEEMWSEEYWKKWYAELNKHVLPFRKASQDHMEIGPPPIWTEAGWLLIYSYIQNYFSGPKTFGVDAVLLDHKDPRK